MRRFFASLWDVRVVFCVLIVAVIFKRPPISRREVRRFNRTLLDLDVRLASVEGRLSALNTTTATGAAPVASIGGGEPRPSDRDRVRPVVSAPSDWRFAVIRGEPCVVFGSGYSYVIRSGHITRFGRVLVIGPDSVLTDRYIVVFGKGLDDGSGSV